ncbi:MAG: RluA family pseudouridine synthase [Saprospiraceae bacterium]|nr:RluA family pseudouridine synthase [Saprospiraceae bacterium]MBK8369890.1 RluA family pseudouridine synthase [Saprospiraceae bacterium]MBK8855803.1 RluA family pseudouridine synthase [Saprospiraceae bacterium]MBK9043353.1 RluA family pseudouridine synthase [Saprospiraceae bacterium]
MSTEYPELDEQQNDDWFEQKNIVVDPGQSPVRIDKFLFEKLEKTSRNRIQNAIETGNILANNLVVKSNYKIKPGDQLSVVLPSNPLNLPDLTPENIPLDIVYEDEEVLVINKQPGLVVHPGVGNQSGTLVNAILYHFKHNSLPVLKGNPTDRPGLVHRIDKDTSGLMVIAKTEHAMTHLAKQFYNHSIERTYTALVWGDVENDKGTVRANVGRHEKDRMLMYAFEDGSKGKEAITHYNVLERFYYVTLIECKLETGRTHQIRVHMKHIGHTLFNDARYGGNKILKGTFYHKYKVMIDNLFSILPRQALHAKSLGFIHPISGKNMYFESSIPEDIETCIQKWRSYFEAKKSLLE